MDQPQKLFPLTLVLGGQRSGKSAHGESLLGMVAGGRVYFATADKNAAKKDGEMTARINAHKKRRGQGWDLAEEPIDIIAAFGGLDKSKPVLLDSLGMWVANMLGAGLDPVEKADEIAEMLFSHPAPVVVISEETGLGVIPDNAPARNFVDALGILNQSIAARADRVVLCVAGIPVSVKNTSS